MMTSMDKEIADVLTGTHTKSSGEVTQLIERVVCEIPNVREELAGYKASASNPSIVGDDTETARQQAVSAEFQLERLSRAKDELVEYRDKLIVVERDERQQAERATWLKARSACEREVAELHERCPHFARVLHKAVKIDKEGQRFSARHTPGTPVNPMDDMVSNYEALPPLISDKLRHGMRMVSSDGTVLFAHVETQPVYANHSTIISAKAENFAEEKENLRQALGLQQYAGTQIQQIEQEAESRSISIEQAAILKGHDTKVMERLQDQADGKMVEEAKAALKQALDKALKQAS